MSERWGRSSIPASTVAGIRVAVGEAFDRDTGLLHARAWQEALELEVRLAETNVEQPPPSVTFVLVDIDDMRSYNDVNGHPVGDRLMVAFWRSLGDGDATSSRDRGTPIVLKIASKRLLGYSPLRWIFDLAGQGDLEKPRERHDLLKSRFPRPREPVQTAHRNTTPLPSGLTAPRFRVSERVA